MSSKTVSDDSPYKVSLPAGSASESDKISSPSINSIITPTQNYDSPKNTKDEKEQVSIFQLANDIEKSLTELQTEISRNEKEFFETINKIEQQLTKNTRG